MTGLSVDYENEGFPLGGPSDGEFQLNVTWDKILWAAITVGRPDIFHVFRYGPASYHEAIFRLSLVRMALQQRGSLGWRLVRTDLFKQMDPTEKGAVNYFIGLLICKLFASKLLDAPWSLHLDVFRPMLNPRTLQGRSRPDMVAQSATTAQWHAFECKGRASVPGENEKRKAKAQALRLVSVDGTDCTYHIGAITFFRNDAIEFYWRDPEPRTPAPIPLRSPEVGWRAYYEPFTEILRTRRGEAPEVSGNPVSALVEELDVRIVAHGSIAPLLIASDWQAARRIARELRHEILSNGFQPDGLRVEAGPSWLQRLEPAEHG